MGDIRIRAVEGGHVIDDDLELGVRPKSCRERHHKRRHQKGLLHDVCIPLSSRKVDLLHEPLQRIKQL
jgi:hypothetical protein